MGLGKHPCFLGGRGWVPKPTGSCVSCHIVAGRLLASPGALDMGYGGMKYLWGSLVWKGFILEEIWLSLPLALT